MHRGRESPPLPAISPKRPTGAPCQEQAYDQALQEMRTTLQCRICEDLLRDPIALPCRGTCVSVFCNACLEDHISASGSYCPLCKVPMAVKDILSHRTLARVVQLVSLLLAERAQGSTEPLNHDAKLVPMENLNASRRRASPSGGGRAPSRALAYDDDDASPSPQRVSLRRSGSKRGNMALSNAVAVPGTVDDCRDTTAGQAGDAQDPDRRGVTLPPEYTPETTNLPPLPSSPPSPSPVLELQRRVEALQRRRGELQTAMQVAALPPSPPLLALQDLLRVVENAINEMNALLLVLHQAPARPPLRNSISLFVSEECQALLRQDTWLPSPVTPPSCSLSSLLLCGSGLEEDQMEALTRVAALLDARVTLAMQPGVTHLVIATDTALKVKVRSMKYFGALAQGSWIVAPAWLEDCLRKRGRRPEAAYEVISDGVHMYSSVRSRSSPTRLLDGVVVYLVGRTFEGPLDAPLTTAEKKTPSRAALALLVTLAGGTVGTLSECPRTGSSPSLRVLRASCPLRHLLLMDDGVTGEEAAELRRDYGAERVTPKATKRRRGMQGDGDQSGDQGLVRVVSFRYIFEVLSQGSLHEPLYWHEYQH